MLIIAAKRAMKERVEDAAAMIDRKHELNETESDTDDEDAVAIVLKSGKNVNPEQPSKSSTPGGNAPVRRRHPARTWQV